MSRLQIKGLTKKFGSALALDRISFDAADGELLTLLGPSGCGKSTTLWSIAGLHQPDDGVITVGDTTLFDGKRVNLPPEDRNCGVVFQSYAIWPHMTVLDNVAYPLKLRRVNKKSRHARAREVLELVEMAPYEGRYPHELSGGQQQRVALARALAHPPRILLLDEPFSNLDAKLRDRAREWLKHLQREIGVTTVFVTHDQDEALSMSDRIVVMSGGKIHQIGTPEEIYHDPADRFVADFIGTTNFLDGAVETGHGNVTDVRLPGVSTPLRIDGPRPDVDAVTVSVRPESIHVYERDHHRADHPNLFPVSVVDRSFLGDHYHYWVRLGDSTLVLESTHKLSTSELHIEIPSDKACLFSADQDAQALTR
ncbi:ABC transporter ATP-binding protein [Rhodococcus opacus]|uniref:ABC-type quaternary amine transporter n=1 Tax=Rhodococcus opacus TaxID=37919 RepID=A0A2S8J9B4_RHOOP|nr:ABC transporter ATP-binding protein [Rhodococcus opacus]PQP23519.1 ABC transporter ATP-binding protein [Rhodococcus opacus]